ncbi:nitroreductase family deazaflavin-dependent oxidoreductase [Nocardia sp. NEAU-G5]|jgi:deazaflavin-dependent oxidoreductase (nitroreductase family)|uniref:Nitroreductase family deazaflavin-dependent oxidoreductase n=1 Tax=Nocardia albiluteola TaxID=2842303 RepID=A0ABS6AYN1_9NOCA|nr:nitroreductase/quinone reductase family protein [Nocardia albiluteola]MBU3062114.1 nitroreductase family deazaflavin-dependent oxidoreductase [Nocardia albiluteola]
MAQSTDKTRSGGPSPLSRWMQLKMNARAIRRFRRTGRQFMGMDLLILHTVGKSSGTPRQSPLAWFADGDDSWLIVASGGGKRNPDWYANMVAHPEGTSVELHGGDPVPVTPHTLDGEARAEAWKRITADQPRYGKYQKKSERQYPVVRLTRR